jgi:hypothetical protein
MLTAILYLYLFLKSDILCRIVPTNRLYILSILDLRINGECHKYEIRMKQLKKKMNKEIDW